MPNLRSVANKYHAQANAIAARGDTAGKLTYGQHLAIAYYRETAAKVEALIRPEDSEAGAVWNLEGTDQPVVTHAKVTAADKAATPQELLKKAK